MAAEAAVTAHDVSKSFIMGRQKVAALKGVSLRVPTGTMTALIGPSGSGKSTLLHLIAGLESVDSGELEVLGRPVQTCGQAELAALRLREIGFVYQDFSLISDLTLVENVRLPLEGMGVVRKQAHEAACEAMARVGLTGLENRFPAEVSGGQQQRTSIARAIVGKRKLVLADEPTGSLDSKTGVEIMEILGGLRDDGVTVVLSTHNPANLSYADQTAELADGSLVGINVRPDAGERP
ncbi:ABC transporter ATP-binding protein [Streptomyces sp. cmx-10-25]|uniref:ABC transporter ATP-binding protein n=1 Tax=Streptomyces sp. cmx-10-25 TaxID=2790919 RepID=UPI0039811A11